MASNIFYTDEFRCIAFGNTLPSKDWESSQKTIIKVSREVIKKIKSEGFEKGEKENFDRFVTSISNIEKRMDPKNRSTLKMYIFALKTFGILRSTANPSIQNLAQKPFVTQLIKFTKENKIENQNGFFIELHDFQEDFLIPSLQSVKTMEEYLALYSLLETCVSSAEVIRPHLSPKSLEILGNTENKLILAWNAKAFQLEPMYQALVSYQKGGVGDLSTAEARKCIAEKISSMLSLLSKNLKNPNITYEEKKAIYQAVKTVEFEFARTGHPIQFPLNDLRVDVGMPIPQAPAPVSAPALRQINPKDLGTIQNLSKQIIDLKPTIGDANAYPFSAKHKSYINPQHTQKGTISMQAAEMRARAKGKKYNECPEEILRLGQDLLRDKSGQCDHMAAAVIAKIVEHIRRGGDWDSTVELAGNGGHAFILINRDVDWRGVAIVDTWLGSIGVHESYQSAIPLPQNGVISNQQDVYSFVRAFGADAGDIQISKRFTPQELRALAFP